MIRTPRWREWKPDAEMSPTICDLTCAIEEVVARLVAALGADGDRWKELIEILDRIPAPQRDAVIDQLLDTDPASLS